MKKIKIASHINRDMKYVSRMYYNVERKSIELTQEMLTHGDILSARERARNKTDDMNLSWEVLISHYSDLDQNSVYRITSNKYGINTVPWSLVQQEEISKKATIIAFETHDSDRLLLIGAAKKAIVGACYIYSDDFIISDIQVTRMADTPIAYTVLEDKLYILLSEEGYDIVFVIDGNKYIDFEAIIQSFKDGEDLRL